MVMSSGSIDRAMRVQSLQTYTPWLHGSTTVDDSGVAVSLAMPYSFWNRINLTQEKRFVSDLPEVELSPEGASETVTLHTLNREDKIDDAMALVLRGKRYSSFERAEQAGRKWRQHLMIAMARSGMGADFGSVDDVESTEMGRPGLRVFEDDGSKILQLFAADVRVKQNLRSFLAGPLRAEHEKPYAPQSDTHELAYSLVHAAHFESNPETVHVLLVTALEAIIDAKRQKRERGVQEIIGEFKTAVKQRFHESDPNRCILLNALGNIKKEGINECGQRVAGELLSENYLEESPADFFKTVYRQRNRIVHGYTTEAGRPTRDELINRRLALFDFVLHLLDADPGQDANDAADEPSADDSGDAGERTTNPPIPNC
jgi:hypothetical protein